MTILHRQTQSSSDRLQHLLLVATLACAALFAGAGCNSDGGSSPSTPSDGITAFGQAILSEDGEPDAYPGYANFWDLDNDFSIASGGSGQFDSALSLLVGAMPFPTNQAYSDLTFDDPALGTSDGLHVAIVYDEATTGVGVNDGTYSLAMQATRNSRLIQTLDLTRATPPITLTFD